MTNSTPPTPTDKDLVTDAFINYSKTFEKIVADNDPKDIIPFFHIPAILIAPEQDPVLLASETNIIVVFDKLIQQLKAAGFDHSKLNTISTKLLSPTEGLVSGTATRYKDKAEKNILQEFGFTYTLRKTDQEWKIIAGIIHDQTTALKFPES